MTTVNIRQAKTHLSALLRRVLSGEEIVIAKSGKPIAKLVPLESPSARRVLGSAEGEIWIATDFDVPLPEGLVARFEK